MKTLFARRLRSNKAFTLIEVLVVIAVIGIIAALILPAAGGIKASMMRKKAQSELSQVVLAIEAYKDKYGHYPPDSPKAPDVPRVNQLYYELLGTKVVFATKDLVVYATLDDSCAITNTDMPAAFGPGVAGFINCKRAANTDDAPAGKAFLAQLKPTQYGEIEKNMRLLKCSIEWPVNHPFVPVTGHPGLNPWRYVSSNPTNNPGAFDLWVDIFIGGKTNRISNWSKVPQIVNTPL